MSNSSKRLLPEHTFVEFFLKFWLVLVSKVHSRNVDANQEQKDKTIKVKQSRRFTAGTDETNSGNYDDSSTKDSDGHGAGRKVLIDEFTKIIMNLENANTNVYEKATNSLEKERVSTSFK